VPIKFLGVGEKPNALEPFQPDRLASRILGMGDVLTLIEKAEANLDQEQSQKLAQKFLEARFDLEDFLSQLQQVKKMGPLSQVLDMIPGMSKAKLDVAPEMADGQVKRIEAIIHSMTLEERHHPEMLGGSRKRRVARGSGTTVQEVNQLLSQFRQMQRMMKQMSSQKGRGGLLSMFRQ
jgi:signal recognition particle subunit SRP54